MKGALASGGRQPRRDEALRGSIAEIAHRYDRVALVLQGGGALGSYQVGVYQALAESGCEPSWISGVSIGAINTALIAGNPPERRIERLDAFWQLMSARRVWPWTPEGDWFRDMRNRASAFMTMTRRTPARWCSRLTYSTRAARRRGRCQR